VDEKRARVKLILASASPRRRELLKRLKIPFRVFPSHIRESSKRKAPQAIVRDLALQKARAIAGQFKEGVVLGADTIVVLGRKVLGKPRDPKDAYRMLYRLSGTMHHVYTGVALVDASTRRAVVSHAKSSVRMRKMPLGQLRALSRQHLDKAGSYAIQEKRDPIAQVVRGSYDNVVGLPISTVRSLLKKLSRAA
jgi:septum formation protein